MMYILRIIIYYFSLIVEVYSFLNDYVFVSWLCIFIMIAVLMIDVRDALYFEYIIKAKNKILNLQGIIKIIGFHFMILEFAIFQYFNGYLYEKIHFTLYVSIVAILCLCDILLDVKTRDIFICEKITTKAVISSLKDNSELSKKDRFKLNIANYYLILYLLCTVGLYQDELIGTIAWLIVGLLSIAYFFIRIKVQNMKEKCYKNVSIFMLLSLLLFVVLDYYNIKGIYSLVISVDLSTIAKYFIDNKCNY